MPSSEEKKVLDQFVAHPGLPREPGTMSSRDGTPYNPPDVPNDISGNTFLNSFPAPAVEASPDQPQPAAPAPPAVKGGQPASTDLPTALETQAAAPEEQPPPLYFGKYKNMEAAEKAWQERENLLRDRNAENIAMKAATTVMENAGFRKERAEPTPPQNLAVQFDKDGQPFIPADVIDKMVTQRAGEIAEAKVQETLQPIAQMNNITNKMQQEFTDFGNDNAAFSGYLAENPEIARRVSNDPEFAMPAAYLMFRELRGQQTQTTAVQTTQRSQTVVDSAKAQASPGGGVAQSSRSIQENEGRDRRLQELKEHGALTGDWRPYQKYRLTEALNLDGTLEAIAKAGWGR